MIFTFESLVKAKDNKSFEKKLLFSEYTYNAILFYLYQNVFIYLISFFYLFSEYPYELERRASRIHC